MNEQTPITEEMSNSNTGTATAQNRGSGGGLSKTIGGFITTAIIVYLLISVFDGSCFSSSYYVAKLPSYNAATVQVDGYMHKSRSCCKKVADAFGAEVISVKPDQKAGTNSYGQTVHYKDCFYYCPLCCN